MRKNDIGAYIFISELHIEHIACPSCILERAQRSFTGHPHFDCPVSLIWIKRYNWVYSPWDTHHWGRCSTTTTNKIHIKAPPIVQWQISTAARLQRCFMRDLNISTGTLTDSTSAKQNSEWRNSYFPRCSCTIWAADLKLWLPLPALESTWKVGFTSSLIVGFTSISCLMPCSNSSAGPTTSPLVIIRTLQQADHSNFQLYNYLTSEIEILISSRKKQIPETDLIK